MIKVKDLLNFILSTTNVCIFENHSSGDPDEDEVVEFYDGPAALVPCALHGCNVKSSYVLDGTLHICIW